jgi:hypothetical protein
MAFEADITESYQFGKQVPESVEIFGECSLSVVEKPSAKMISNGKETNDMLGRL